MVAVGPGMDMSSDRTKRRHTFVWLTVTFALPSPSTLVGALAPLRGRAGELFPAALANFGGLFGPILIPIAMVMFATGWKSMALLARGLLALLILAGVAGTVAFYYLMTYVKFG